MSRHLERAIQAAGKRRPSAGQIEQTGARVLEKLRIMEIEPMEELPTPSHVAKGRRSLLAVACAAAALLVAALYFIPLSTDPALAKAVDGGLYFVSGDSVSPVAPGQTFKSGQVLRTGAQAGAEIALIADGSQIEAEPNAELFFQRVDGGVRIHLNSGGFIVNASKASTSPVYVETPDSSLSVGGALLSVRVQGEGARLSVLQGEVQVRNAGKVETVGPGEQVSTNPAIPSISLQDEIRWSRNAARHLALVEVHVQAQAPTEVQTGEIRGTVRSADTSEPLSNIQVTLEAALPTGTSPVVQTLANTAAAFGISFPASGASQSQIDFTVKSLMDGAASRGSTITRVDILAQLPAIAEMARTVATKIPAPVTTDRDGAFAFRGLPPGQYSVRANREGYFGKPVNGVYSSVASTDFSVVDKQVRELELSMVRGATVGGRVSDAAGRPLSNTNVQAFRVGYESGYPVLQVAATKTTDDRGDYRLFWLPPGEYYIAATETRTGSATPALKTFSPGVSEPADAAMTSLRAGEDIGGIDIRVRPTPTLKISGQITNLVRLSTPGAIPAPTATLILLNRNESVPDDLGVRNLANVPLTDSSGKFEIPNLRPGSYDLLARVPDPLARFEGGAAFSFGRVPIELRNADLDGITIEVNSRVELQGTVRFIGGAAAPPDIRIRVAPDDTMVKLPAYAMIAERGAIVGKDGTFTVSAIPEGLWRGSLSGLTPDLYLSDIRQNGIGVFDSGFEVNPKLPGALEFVVSSGAAAVEGVVAMARDGAAKPVAGATVVLVPEQARRRNRSLFRTAVSDAAGRFSVRGIAPGAYKLFAFESIPAGAHMNPAFLARHEDRGRAVTVGQSSGVSAELTVIPAIERR